MMKDSQKIEFAAIVVYRLDRISRNIGDFAKLIEDLGDRHIDFISIREQFDTSSPMGRAMMYIASVFSQLERETIAERIRDNMHELSKTGRWLGGTTPTGYASESESKITVDGKERKAYKLKPIPEEIQLVKTIFSVFMETGSLSKTDQYLLEHRCVTKRGKQFTRFAIRGILTNPVYMIADETAYQYLKENNADLFAEQSEFDGEHGIMAYNRTLQRPGKANQIRPMEEWIVAVGKHPGIISGSDWVQVQAMLDVNKSKSYRRPRSNVALLSGLLRCGECGDYMRPKLTNRTNADGDLIYTYMCSTKERSHGTVCGMKNCNGNTLDAKIIEEIRKLSADKETLAGLLAQTKKVINGNKEGYDAELAQLREKHAETEERIKRLVDSLSVATDTSAKYVMEQIDELHQQSEQERSRLSELEALTEQSRMLHQEFAFHQEMIESFAHAVDTATLEEKRRLLRTIVKKVVWICHPLTNLCIRWERIANEILMHFRAQRKLQGEVSLSEAIETDKAGNALYLQDVVGADDTMQEDLEGREDQRLIRRLVGECLTPREADVIRRRYGLDGHPPQTQRQVAAAYGISRSYVSRIEKRALEKLETALREHCYP